MSLQEKFQFMAPGKMDEEDSWKTFESARRAPGEAEGEQHLPPGMEIGGGARFGPAVVAGSTDVSQDAGPEALRRGYTRRADVQGADDQYTGEHLDLFYGEAVDTEDHSKVGFAERNNYLDRI